ncbi:hypothetical protein AMAG_12929 [Allomyces macrogynus ATCC 38327]|uniref:Uncharacterized protein n=1 Tax=Allomyces macrogynus (strain ATCC 38327) TaxID=578462 RepID=A0A0L0T0S7_ALLM3|nr:hypothetical protein AMAG_12929 [Allomyces macrogynus ATCC 38327]|eukprot:KNE68255.1 hypothetical protein AMAG_12929 [Allomyces macrogynus ATCC 38327]
MGKAKRVGGKRVASKSSRSSSSTASAPAPPPPSDPETALPLATALVERGELAEALQLAQHVLSSYPTHLTTLELVGTLLLDLGKPVEAKSAFDRYVAVDQNNASVLLYLAQLSAAKDAVAWYQRAGQVLEAKLAAAGGDVAELKEKISEALCGIAEIYLTDLCFEPEAADTCLTVLHRAIQVDPSNPDPYLTLASVQISNSQPLDAKSTLQSSLAQWLQPFMAYLSMLSDPEKMMELERTNAVPDPPRLPTFDARLNAVRLCLELGLYGRAFDVLGVCMQEFDESVEAWYLFGWTYFLVGTASAEAKPTTEVAGIEVAVELPEDEVMDARSSRDEWWSDAIECLQRAKALYERQNYDDVPLLQHVEELLAEMAAKGVFASADGAGEDDDNAEDDDGEWEDMEL